MKYAMEYQDAEEHVWVRPVARYATEQEAQAVIRALLTRGGEEWQQRACRVVQAHDPTHPEIVRWIERLDMGDEDYELWCGSNGEEVVCFGGHVVLAVAGLPVWEGNDDGRSVSAIARELQERQQQRDEGWGYERGTRRARAPCRRGVGACFAAS